MSTLQYTDGIYTETVDGWTLTTHDYSEQVQGVQDGPCGQTFCIERDGDICVEVNNNEVGCDWSGDVAADRHIPVTVIVAAIRIWTAAKERA